MLWSIISKKKSNMKTYSVSLYKNNNFSNVPFSVCRNQPYPACEEQFVPPSRALPLILWISGGAPSLRCNHDDRRVLPPARLAVWLCQQHGPVEERGGGRRWRVPRALCHPGHSHRWTVAVLCAQTRWHTKVKLSHLREKAAWGLN